MKLCYYVLALAVCCVGVLSLVGILPPYQCFFATGLGVACPMCGTTRAWLHFTRGELGAAFYYNPFFLVWGFWLLVGLVGLVERGRTGNTVTVTERCMRRVAENRPLRAFHIVGFVCLLFYTNLVGPTAVFRHHLESENCKYPEVPYARAK
jgi:hypothetical protein